MGNERESPSVTDYAVTALSPALVMLMVGSLVFFLVEVLYEGKYSGRLLYTLFFFVSATVLVARISIRQDAGRAAVYGIALGVVTYLALLAYVEYPKGWLGSWGWLVNLGLMALIWWSAHKLTWDCTHIDEGRESSGRGLLNAAGLVADETTPASREPQASATPKAKKTRKKVKKAVPDSRLWDWIEKYKAHREATRKAGHTPGVWVLYFALAALPVFAVGQSLIDSADGARRRAAFLQMAVYVASALGLLVTTSLLGVRRYMRQRKAKVPPAMTASWLGLGGVLIVLFVAVGALLPRPHSEVPWFGFEKASKSERDASRYAQSGTASGKGEGRGGNETAPGAGANSAKGGQPGGGTTGANGGGKGREGKGGGGSKGDQSGGTDRGGGKGSGSDTQTAKDQRDGRTGTGTDSESREAQDAGSAQDGGSRATSAGGMLEKVAGAVKWLVYAIVVLLLIFGLFFGLLKYLAPFTDWARRWLDGLRAWWAGLFGTRAEGARAPGGPDAPPVPERPPPFSAYSNPFADGTAETRDPAELIAYTFEALDAWAHDRGAGREPAETPLEFVRRLGERFPEFDGAFGPFAHLYARSAYSERPLPGDAGGVLEQVWEQMVYGPAVGV